MIVYKNNSFLFSFVNKYSTMSLKPKNNTKNNTKCYKKHIIFWVIFVFLQLLIFCQWTFFHRRTRRKKGGVIWVWFFIKIFEKKNFEKIKLKIFKSFLEIFLKNTNLFLEHFDLNSIFKIVKRNIFHRNFQKQKSFELK